MWELPSEKHIPSQHWGEQSSCSDQWRDVTTHSWLMMSGYVGRIPPHTRQLAWLSSCLLGLEYEQGLALAAQRVFPRHNHRCALMLKIITVVHIHFHDLQLTVSLPLQCSPAQDEGEQALGGRECYSRGSVMVISLDLPTNIH